MTIRKQLTAVVAMLMVFSFAVTGASAKWSVADTLSGNQAHAGTLGIDAVGQSNCPHVTASGEYLLPGDVSYGSNCDVVNTGNREHQQYVRTANFNGALCQYVTMYVTWGGTVMGQNGNTITSGHWTSQVPYPNGLVAASAKSDFDYELGLHPNTPQELMGGVCVFDLIFTGEQGPTVNFGG